MEQSRTSQPSPWIAIGEAGTVIGHYAMMRHRPGDSQGEMGAAFVLPEARKGGVFRLLSDRLHAEAAQSGVAWRPRPLLPVAYPSRCHPKSQRSPGSDYR
jgi:hypothetical protein